MRERLAALVVACLFVLLGRNGRAGVAWDDEVRFMLHIRVGQTLSPRKLKVLRKDTAFEASLRFCNELLAHKPSDRDRQASIDACVQSVGPAVARRLRWAREKEFFMPVRHNKSLPRSVDFDAETPRFDANSPMELRDGIKFLRENGYAVFRGVGTPRHVDTGVNLMWDYLESLEVGIRGGSSNMG